MRLADKKAMVWIAVALITINASLYLYHTKHETQSTTAPLPTPKSKDSNESSHAPARLFTFDPNTADSATFVTLGLRPRVARAIVNYRKAGGVFRTPDDLSRIYTLQDSDFQRLRPYIKIASVTKSQAEDRNSNRGESSTTNYNRNQAFLQQPVIHSNKIAKGQTVDISTADSLTLQRIPGIGPYYAHKIIRYRDRLGGFVNLLQLKEIQGLPDNIETFLRLGNTPLVQLQINHFTFGKLLRHPYLNYEQVQAILNHRKTYGPIHSFNDLATYPVFSSTDMARLAPYVDFSD